MPVPSSIWERCTDSVSACRRMTLRRSGGTRRAAEQDYALAQVTLGFFYSFGRGVPQDNVSAHMWLNLGASKLSGELRERAIRGRDDVASRMAPADINEAQRLAREWRPRD